MLFVRGPICLDLNDISNLPAAYTKNTATMWPSITSSYLSLITLLFSSANYRFTIIFLVLVHTRCPLRVTAQQ